jgi:DNA-binding NarL/FixJ family response regulator
MSSAPSIASSAGQPDAARPRARVILVSPHPLERAGLRALLERSGEAEITLEFSSLADPPHGSGAEMPDAVLVDVDGDAAGGESVRRACDWWRGAPALALVRHFDFARARELILAGARGVLAKEEAGEQLLAAVRKVQEHELWLDRATTARLIDELSAVHTSANAERDPRVASLTEREAQIVELVAKGLSNKSIASRLDISDNTVRHHLTSIFAKLGVHDRLALAVFAFRNKGR